MLIGTNHNLSDSRVVKQDERYIVQDNTKLKNLVVSITMLQRGCQTNGHSHKGQEEVYIFTQGHGVMEIDDALFAVSKGDTILIEDGVFHKVYNNGTDLLKFTCIFDGKRHK